MNLARIQQRYIDCTSTANLLKEGLITKEQADYLQEDFERRLHYAMQTKGFALPADAHPYPTSEMLRRFSGEKEQAGRGIGV
ncbi:MAG: hypothetical protein E7331_11685 [Clostridiales bacterium]|jgi:hypothetical protein|nr:hypothetical protein [Clostridiales bacterium]